MARGVNKVILIGNCGSDPEIKNMPSGGDVATLSLATSESWKDKQSGQMQERTEWHKLVFFGKVAEIAGKYVRKGSKLYVEGQLRTRKWQDQQGIERWTTEIVVGEFQLLDGRAQDGQQQAAPAQQQQRRAAPSPSPAPGPDNFDDDIPF